MSGGQGDTLGGLVGYNNTAGVITASAFDTLTTGQASGIGGGRQHHRPGRQYRRPDHQPAARRAARRFRRRRLGRRSGPLSLPASLLPQRRHRPCPGFTYASSAGGAVGSGAGGAVPVSLTLNGVPEPGAYSGANGYYYVTLAAGTIARRGRPGAHLDHRQRPPPARRTAP